MLESSRLTMGGKEKKRKMLLAHTVGTHSSTFNADKKQINMPLSRVV